MSITSKAFLAVLYVLPPTTSSAAALSPPDGSIPSPNVTNAITRWSRGHLFVLAKETEDGSITVYSTTGDVYQAATQTRIWPEGTQTVLLYDAAAAPSGTVFAAAGSAVATNGSRAGFIPFFGPGRTQLLVQLPNWATYKIVFADDGTLWVLGRQFDSTLQDAGDYNALRHYSAEGKFLGSAVPRASVAGTLQSPPMLYPSLTASSDTIGAYFDKTQTWVELSYDGSIKGQWSVPKIPLVAGQNMKMARLLLTGSNQIVREYYVNSKLAAGRGDRIEYLRKSDSDLIPTAMDVSTYNAAHPFFLGIDGDEVVWLGDSTTLNWSKLQH